ncbi:hypothetical protein [Flavobacterium psychrophilum]|uniref:hypothetical protein n=1 Tax=Flavobacterium psychrophilum TaxID=96345 RepID=UPI000B7C1624|nr:hypothetical protein [Flavobacterium psychrophilum]MBF2024078.1 hypothetical protein [Flavobacterium psychrophilum]MCB5984478.1 hypothetical protein [Flavobacterium psychrophilum]MCB5995538.1 hypothetical protein [Flavobacterium psychrophilum]MCB5997956.1 hypothetical protein [Flavobacterium psychrophilum]MCB6005453.1 hypothetical protein [Flavobacterium psychrophilum]
MASTSETGHAKNVANFQNLITFVTAYGAIYNPSKYALQLPQLIALYADADTKLTDVVAKNTAYNNKINERQFAFSGLKSLATRLVNALQTTDATDQIIKDAKGFNRKIQGQKASSSTTAPTEPNTPAPNTISSSQQSYTQQIQHLAGLISVLQSEPSYTPNETNLQIPTLLAIQNELITRNNEVATSYANLSNARIARNTTLYSTSGSVFEVAAEVKKYIKSLFGASSPEFAQVKGIEFKKAKK